ncbi:putative quinol monooxygenase [Halioglobus maricola]|uniref:putative quinol monooxygenase n=1 Tax=Halioglobus maricola TaxID=2601894 RepID=UPI001F10C206|nr:antibiotic biosynthesis monooxygenase [Halioglobus maricola]
MAELPMHIALTLQESGCKAFEVTQDSGDARIFRVYEKFSNRSAFEAHQSRVEGSLWGSITANAERHYDISEGS